MKKHIKIIALLSAILFAFTCANIPASAETELIAGGNLFGVKMKCRGVTVVSFGSEGACSAARDAGVHLHDVLLEINGEEIGSAERLAELVKKSGGKPLALRLLRGGDEREISISPTDDGNGGYKIGVWVRDTAAGIGTVTYYIKNSDVFAGLGHGICDAETGSVLEMENGIIEKVTFSSVTKGKAGTPGEIHGFFAGEAGVLLKNTDCGVSGRLDGFTASGEAIPESDAAGIHPGEAELLCTVTGGGTERYKIEILKVNILPDVTKSFTIRVTDKKLLDITGGIVQGMSGSPILQDGKLAGAVTHVFVSDPTKGYGIFIGNMRKIA